VQKTVAGATTKYLVADENPTGYAQVLEEDDSTGPARQYTYGLDLISRWDTNTGLSIYYVHDGHGSVRALTDQAGAVTDTYDYDAFGNLIHQTGTTPNNYLFAGEQFDPDLNLYYNRARYLNTSTGRFWSMDTEEGDPNSPISLHRYLYASDDSANALDPTGHDEIAEYQVGQAGAQTVRSGFSDKAAYQALTNYILASSAGPQVFGIVGKIIVFTLVGAILAGVVSPLYNVSNSEDVMLRNGHRSGDYGIFAFGDNVANPNGYVRSSGSKPDGPRAPRIRGITQFDPSGIEDIPVVNGMVGPGTPLAGPSAFEYPENTSLSGKFWGVRVSNFLIVEGLGVIPDGPVEEGGHHTIFPLRPMTPREFVDKFYELSWVYAGRKK